MTLYLYKVYAGEERNTSQGREGESSIICHSNCKGEARLALTYTQ